MMQVPLSSPDIIEKDIEAVVEVMKTRFLSIGPKVVEFEKRIREYAGTKYAVAVNIGTSALHLIIRGLGIGEGDKIVTTPFSFIASSNCVLFERAKPLFVDIKEETLNLNSDKVEEKLESLSGEELARIKALLVVDAFGQAADWDRFEDIDKVIELLFLKEAKAIISVCEVDHHPLWANTLPEDGCMKDFIKQEIMNKNRQELPVFYRLNGAIYLAYCDYLRKQRSFFGEKTFAYIMSKERSIDIDYEVDLKLAQILMKK